MEPTPQEIEVWYVLPAIRRELCKSLIIDYKKSQKECSSLLGLTEAAVSHYIKEKRAKEVTFNKGITEEIKKSAKIVADDKKMLIREIHRLCGLITIKKIVCELHKKQSEVPLKCKVCLG